MKKSRYKEEQIVSILREAESNTVTAAARKHGVAVTFPHDVYHD